VWPADARQAARVAAGTLLWLAVWFGIGAWLAVYVVGLLSGPRSLPPIPGAVPTQPEATAWASPATVEPARPTRGYWYHFRKLTGARAATLPVWAPEPIRDADSW